MTDNQKELVGFSTKLPPMSSMKGKTVCAVVRPDGERSAEIQSQVVAPSQNRTKRKKRCAFKGCKKKLKLTSVECRCKQKFCSAHFHYEKHNCSFDYMELSRRKLGIALASNSRVDKIDNRI